MLKEAYDAGYNSAFEKIAKRPTLHTVDATPADNRGFMSEPTVNDNLRGQDQNEISNDFKQENRYSHAAKMKAKFSKANSTKLAHASLMHVPILGKMLLGGASVVSPKGLEEKSRIQSALEEKIQEIKGRPDYAQGSLQPGIPNSYGEGS